MCCLQARSIRIFTTVMMMMMRKTNDNVDPKHSLFASFSESCSLSPSIDTVYGRAVGKMGNAMRNRKKKETIQKLDARRRECGRRDDEKVFR